jgi:hypothetical protein
MDYHWHIMETFNNEQGNLNRIRWGYFVRDGAYMQEVLGELTDLPAEAQGQPASAFTNDTMIQWVQNALGTPRMSEIHDEVNAKLAANKDRDPQ